jgi:hypothetical protein
MARKRWFIAVAVLVALLVAIEVTVRQWERPKGCVQITNEGQGIMEDVVVFYHDTQLSVGRILKGQSAQVWLTAGPVGPLRLEYRQKSSAMQGFQIADFDPAQNAKDGFKQVLVIGNNQIQRFVEDDDTRKDERSVGEKIIDWFKSEM